MKRQNIYKKDLPYQSEFDHKYACWASNHNGWARMKKFNKKLAKIRERNTWKQDIKKEDFGL